jgi:secreted trypsin-like serine protease
MGIINLDDNGPQAQTIDVSFIKSHPQYKSNEKYNDIALVKLKTTIRFDEHVRPACIATEVKSRSKMIAIGFGKTKYGL